MCAAVRAVQAEEAGLPATVRDDFGVFFQCVRGLVGDFVVRLLFSVSCVHPCEP